MVGAGSPEFLPLHVHTNTPARVREIAMRFGAVDREKVDDMWVQHAEGAAPRSPQIETHVVDGSPALGVHAGVGAFGLAILDMAWVERRIAELGGRG